MDGCRFSLLVLLIVLAAVLIGLASAHPGPEEEMEIEYNYGSNLGSNKWGNLHQHYETCLSGKMQSPIDIDKNDAVLNETLGSLIRKYTSANATLVNHIYSVGVLFEEDFGELVIDGRIYTLKQMHWHTPSEHQINGVRYDAELHLVHQAYDDGIAVVAILYQLGKDDPLVSALKNKLEELADDDKCKKEKRAEIPLGKFDSKLIKIKPRKYYRYLGSLTTPPCTEYVVWTVLARVRTISNSQVEMLRAPLDKPYKKNARPVQVLNGRKIQAYYDQITNPLGNE